MVEQGAQDLPRFVRQIDLHRAEQSALLAVIWGTGYVCDDGVAVLPIGALAP